MNFIKEPKLYILLLIACVSMLLASVPVENESKTNKMKIEIWSDVVCPWCYIGKRRFESALQSFEFAQHLDIEWKSYQLDPEMQTDTTLNIHQYLADRKGMSLAQAKAMGNNVTEVAAKEGLHYDFSKTIPVNTIKAHRLLHFAKTLGKQDAMKEALLYAYFTEGKNLDDNKTLIILAQKIGIDGTETQQILESEAYLGEVEKDIYEGQQLGLRGVPFFVFNRKYGISGAQDAKVFSQTLQKAFTEWVKANPSEQLQVIEGKVCTPDGFCE